MRATNSHTIGADEAVERLVQREEVLQICYWYEGEGFGNTFSVASLAPFLNCRAQVIESALAELAALGRLQAVTVGYRFTEEGRREAGRLFAEEFADFQRPAHGECEAGCCESDDHSQCGEDCPYH